ncbi:MAG: protein-L-isoaspartate O-methyltransferase [Rhodospirillaceae bacterium]|nr:protein-L-isoaspartate O-methyltransferase [Rhodospirillaceae bacterium]MBL6929901.1 protein-L-isoaspartate O-methyltransferase [Rhodospirillales bacterium]MBL6941621.1 protein-L-isoaspartate O-methyltransferase [Rhodospirillales bacterium]
MDYATARHNMVESQIKPNRVTDTLVMDALAQLPREQFVPKAMQGIAYIDEAIDIGGGRHLMEAWVLARLLQAAEVQPDDVALVVGCGSGYEAAVLSTMASTVVALESDDGLAKQANEVLAELSIDTVAVVGGGLARGYARQAPYDVIFINGAVSAIPERFGDQLAEGGRLVCIVGQGAFGKGTLMTRYGDVVTSRTFFDGSTPTLPGFETDSAFSF